jgi:hypothetical protein
MQTVEGMKSLKTTTGHHVNHVAKGKYQLAVLHLDLHSDEADAP